jgi:uncharacterized protein YjdB
MRFRLFTLLLAAACGGGTTEPVSPPPPPPPPPGPAPVFTVVLNRDTATLVPRQSVQLVAVPRDQAGNGLGGRTVTWSSSTATVASVAGDGLVTAVAAGTSAVSATSEGKSGSATITVKDGAVVSTAGGVAATADSVARVTLPAGAVAGDQAITIAPVANPLPHPRLIAGTAYDFGPSLTFAQAATIKISFAGTTVPVTADPSRLRLHRLTGGAWVEIPGSTVDLAAKTVTGQTSSFSTYAIVELAPLPVATVTLARDTATLVPQQTLQLVAVLKDQSGGVLTGRTMTWSSSAIGIASVSEAGIVSAVAAGTAMITASSEGKTATGTITVKDGALMGVSGGVVATANGVAKVTFPAGAVASNRTITIDPVLNPVASPLLVAGTAFDFGPSGNFAQPVSITISYAGTTVPVATDAAKLRLHRLTGGVWVEVPGSTVDVNAKTVTGQTGSFSTYAVLGKPTVQETVITFDYGVGPVCSLPGSWTGMSGPCGLGFFGTWTVPEDVFTVTVELWGASGGGLQGAGTGRGKGGKTTATFAVVPGEILQVLLGPAGGGTVTGQMGSAGGGFGAGLTHGHHSTSYCIHVTPTVQNCPGGNGMGGGGSTDIRYRGNGSGLPGAPGRIAVAGGGGGDGGLNVVDNGQYSNASAPPGAVIPGGGGGHGGGLVGASGSPGQGSGVQSAPLGGQGGTQLEGGPGGTGAKTAGGAAAASGESGTSLWGGGRGGIENGSGGGGGGGGWFGGGGGGPSFYDRGGATGGGGGGGSSHGPPGSVFFQGVHVGHGKAILTFTPSPGLLPTAVALSSSANPSASTQNVTFTAAVTPKPPATGTITGSVQFEVDGAVVGGGPIVLVNGQASSGPLQLAPGPHLVRVVFLGSTTHAPSGMNLTQTVTP